MKDEFANWAREITGRIYYRILIYKMVIFLFTQMEYDIGVAVQ